MIVYLYALVDESLPLHGLVGGAGEPLRPIDAHGLIAIAGDLPAAPATDRDTLHAQDLVVRRLHERSAALVPMRFGACFAGEADVRRALQPHARDLLEKLRNVRGQDQMTLRVYADRRAATETSPPAAAALQARRHEATAVSGTGYLRQRAEAHTPPEITPLLSALQPLRSATHIETGKQGGLIATVYHLIPRGSATAYLAVAEHVRDEMPAVSVRVTGPSPCYAFA